jgi:4'-phosphopantetheinyl transferase
MKDKLITKARNPKAKSQNRTIYPVILAVPDKVGGFKPKDRVTFLSRHARRALKRSAQKSGIRLDELPKDENGAPLPVGGVYWSITHKTNYVGGVVSPAAIGIDIEKIRRWALAKTEKNSQTTFFRFWTSKEAVLKAFGTGIKDLRKCRIYRIQDAAHLEIRYEGKNWLIEHFFFDRHIASIVKDHFRLDWSIEK